MSADLARIKRNVQKMVDQGAPVKDIDGYIASEGVTLDQVRGYRGEHMAGKGVGGTTGDFASRANDALLGGAGEEYRAFMKALPSLFPGGRSFSESYQANLDAENARRGRIQRERPVVDVLGQSAGLGAQMGAGMALQGAGMLPGVANSAMGRIAQAGGTGAIVGGVSGLADTESRMGLGERGLWGIGLGAAIGTGLGAGVEGAGALANKFLTRTPQDRAMQRVATRMTDQNLTPAQAAGSKREASRLGIDDYSLMDVGGRSGNAGTQLQRLGRNVADQPGQGSAILDDFVTGRQAGQYDRMTRAVGRDVSPIVPKDDVREALKKAGQRAAGPLYRQGAMDVVPVDKALKVDLSKPSVRNAWATAEKLAAEDGVQLEPLFMNGQFNPKIEQISARTAHYLRQALDDLVGAETRIMPNGAKEMSNLGGAYSITRKHIDTALKAASPSYRKADEIFSRMSTYRSAIESGSKFAQRSPDQLAGTLSRLTPESRAMYRLGAAWDMARKLGEIRDGRDIAKVFMASPADRQRLQALMGSERNLNNLMSTLRLEREMSTSFDKIIRGSRTSAHLADQTQEGARAVGDAIRSGPYQSAKNMVARVVESMGGMSEAERRAIAEILTTTDDAGFAELMGQLTRTQARQAGQRQLQGAIETVGTLQLTREHGPR